MVVAKNTKCGRYNVRETGLADGSKIIRAKMHTFI